MRLAVIVAALLLAGPSAAFACGGQGTTAKTAHYVFTVAVGMPEKMYSPAQEKALKPQTGEVMLSATITGGHTGMASGSRHLEVHICSRTTGKTITDANPSISVTGPPMQMAMLVGVMRMRGVGKGAADTHYGNNVTLKPGATYGVMIRLKHELATVSVRVPR
jgi:hypothetical protein